MAFNSTSFEDGLHHFGPQLPGHFDFSSSFEFSIFSILPSAILLVAIPFRLRLLYRQSRKVSRSLLHGNKLSLLALFTALQCALLVIYATNSSIRRPASLAAAVLVLIDGIGLCLLSHFEHVRSIRPSTIINIYLFVTMLFDIAQIRTLWIQDAPKSVASIFTVTVAVKFLVAIMEATEKKKILLARYKDTSPEATSGIYSRAFFWWLQPLMSTGFKRVIREEDLFTIEEDMSSSVLRKRGQKLWSTANKSISNALFWSTLNSTRRQFVICIFPRLCLIAFRYAQPFLLSRTADFVKSKDAKNIGWGLTGAFGIVFLGSAVADVLYSHMTFRFTTAIRGTLVSMIYEKTVDLSITALDESAAITLMSSDTETICGSFSNLHELWAVPVEIGIAMWLLQRELGLSFLAPAAVAIISTLSLILITKCIGRAQKFWNEAIQTRVDVTTAMLGSMKALKILGFTPVVTEIVQGLRVKELKIAGLFRRLLCTSTFFANNMRLLAPFVTFVAFVLIQGHTKLQLTPATAFTTLSLVGLLSSPFNTLLRTIPQVKSALACFTRIQSFLVSPSRQPHVLPLEHSTVDVRNASFSWSLDSPPIIKIASFSVTRNSFVFIIGPVGCGKSTLLKGLMSETPSSQGFVYSSASGCSFVDQTPWVQNTTIRRNIIGPAILDDDWYQEVIRACALDHDIEAMPDLNDTIVGSKGISLSGGQKQRVALARALYSKNELMIIDDGFSGLDAETEERVFTYFFGKQGLLKRLGTTVVLVTHAVHRLPYADHIISLDGTGHITEQGSFEQLRNSGGYVENLAVRHRYESSSVPSDEFVDDSLTDRRESAAERLATQVKAEEEDLSRPMGEWSTYRYYFASIGWSRSLLSLFYLTLSGTAVKVTELLVTYWTNAISEHGNEANPLYLGLFGLLAGIGVIFYSVSTYHYFLYVVPGSAEELHARLLRSVMNAPLSFFTSIDTGVTTNRFSQDMSIVDKELPFALIDLIISVVQCFMGGIFMCLVSGYFALTLPPVLLVVWVIQKFYLRTSRQVRLLDLEAKSPLYTHFIESLSGLATIRAFGWSSHFVSQNLVLLDNSQKPYYLLFCIQRWLSIVLEVMVAILAIILMVLVVEFRDSVEPGYVGLALLNVISFSSFLIWMVKQWTSLETSIGAISRLKTFTTTTPNENLPGEDQPVPVNWPAHGAIEIRNLSASYSPSGTPILNGITLSIKAGEKIGVCGRTGSGKSSLIMTLFQLLKISPESSVFIDNIDITKIPRHVLRERLNAIPQDPFFLKGSIRFNASPSHLHTDEQIISAFEKVELWSLIEVKGGLDAELSAEFFSHGQRQLFCLARAILRKSKIVVLDEVSSSVDIETDKLMQRVVREEFKDATVVSVAHRLETIVDFNRVVVMGDGAAMEMGEPRELLVSESRFRELWNS
ncbi:putative multidrug resistance-associated protein [Stipitochalara longipes BDJ]|nr:putative multidrug resistance-associated protein [Stipitochalara longipes BDJ]